MKNIENLSSLEGRSLLREIFKELRYEKQNSSFSTLAQCWRICVNERELFRYIKKEVTVLHPMGFFGGTGLWLEEVLNRYYFSTINSFVYFGAAVLLVLIGIRRFSNAIDDNVVIAGIGFEALMLIFMFVIMLFTPNDEVLKSDEQAGGPQEELLGEIGEIGRDFAAVVIQLEQLGSSIEEMLQNQSEIINTTRDAVQISAQAVAPNPAMLESMSKTNEVLSDFRDTVHELVSSISLLKREQIEMAVKKEIEKIITGRLTKDE